MTEDKSFVLEYYIPDHPSVKKDKKAEKEAAVAWLDNKLSEFEQQKKYDEWYLEWLDGFKDRKDLDKISKEMIREQLEYVKRRNELMRKLNDHRP